MPFPRILVQTLSIRQKLLMAFMVVIASLVAIAAAAIALHVRSVHRAAFTEAQHVAAEIATDSDLGQESDPEHMQRRVLSMGRVFDRELMIVNRDGRVMASTKLPRGTALQHAAVLQVIGDGVPRKINLESTGRPPAMQVVVPLPPPLVGDDRGRPGVVILEYTRAFDQQMQEAWQAAIATTIAALVLVILTFRFAIHVTRAIVRPLVKLEHAAAAIAADNFDVRLQVQGADELSRLGEAFNRMAHKLATGRAALHERNAELAEANAQLQGEVAKSRTSASRIEYLAFHDSLTALPNRESFNSVLTGAVDHAQRFGQRFSLFFLDLDRFKQINDTLGHEAGDQLLQEVGHRLATSVGVTHTVARLGGDEFVVLAAGMIDQGQAAALAQEILSAVGKPYMLRGQELRVTASVGISRFAVDGTDEQTLMKHADVALYQAKENGRNGFAFYAHELNSNSFERLALESSLRRAISRNELLLHYQPKQDLRTGKITGMEALVRWQHPESGLVPPCDFIPLAEDTGLIVPLGKWVLRTACQQTVQWHALGMTDLVVAVNLSPRQLCDENLLRDVITILRETGMNAARLELEITESAIMQDAGKGLRVLNALKAMGIRIAIDDFGTGYSSLSTLKQFPIDTLKIDRSFIRDLGFNPEDRGLTKAIIAMGKTLKLHLVAEGVETAEQSDFLKAEGCDAIQGYHFSKPVPADAFEQLVQQPLDAHSAVVPLRRASTLSRLAA